MKNSSGKYISKMGRFKEVLNGFMSLTLSEKSPIVDI